VVSFQTRPCEPDEPFPPKNVGSRKKGELTFRWLAPNENGSKIINYTLEFKKLAFNLNGDIVETNEEFVQAYKGPLKQFILKKLSPATCYGVRLSAENSCGTSNFSKTAVACTSGCVPNTPDAPRLATAAVTSLGLHWQNDATSDDVYELQMFSIDDSLAAQHGFLTVFNGQASSYTVTNLKRSSAYKFRLRANNDEGYSPWSESASYSTTGDLPGPPEKLRVRVQPSVTKTLGVKVTWDAAKDDGGSRIKAYRVELSSLDEGEFRTVYEGERLECLIEERLEPGVGYCVRALCSNAIGSSDVSYA